MSSPILRRGLSSAIARDLPHSLRAGTARFLPIALLSVAIPHPALACASCGCTLNADAAMGYSASAGWRVSMESDYLHQDELRSGTRSASGVPDGNELERETLNRYITAGMLPNMQVYGFAQFPVYSNLYGYQLFPRWTASGLPRNGFK